MQFSNCTKQCNTLAKCAKTDIFETTAHSLHKKFKPRGFYPPPLPAIHDCCPSTAGSKERKMFKRKCSNQTKYQNHKKEKQRAYFGGEESVDDKDKRLQRELDYQ